MTRKNLGHLLFTCFYVWLLQILVFKVEDYSDTNKRIHRIVINKVLRFYMLYMRPLPFYEKKLSYLSKT